MPALFTAIPCGAAKVPLGKVSVETELPEVPATPAIVLLTPAVLIILIILFSESATYILPEASISILSGLRNPISSPTPFPEPDVPLPE